MESATVKVCSLLLLLLIECRLLMAQFSTDILYKEVNFNIVLFFLSLNRAEN